jgi:hypothetical protein
LWLQIMLTLVPLCVAVYVGHVSRQVLDALRRTKRINDLEVTMSDLQSSFTSLLESHKRLRSRTGMRELRDETKRVETKADARRRIFGTAMGPQAAKIVQGLAVGRNQD